MKPRPAAHVWYASVAFLSLAACGTAGTTIGPVGTGEIDLIIANGQVLDGTGNPWFAADVGVDDGVIVAVGDLSAQVARKRIDASGNIVAPGFIDLHSHADDDEGADIGLRSADVRRRRATNLVTQGITTVVVNPDGLAEPGLSIADQRAQLEAGGVGVNVALMVAHNAIRRDVMGDDHRRPATRAELQAMRERVRAAMEEGAFGLTSGLEYVPGRWSETEELVALMQEVAPYHGIHVSHIRSESSAPMWWLPSRDSPGPSQLLDGVSEIIAVAERTGTTGVLSHMKVRGTTHWGKSKDVIALVESARARGVEVYGDQYPYATSGSDGHIVLIPAWVFRGDGVTAETASPAESLRRVLEDDAQRRAMITDIEHAVAFRGGGENIVVFDHPDRSLIGRNLGELAEDWGITAVDVILRLQLQGYADRPGGARLRSFSLAEADIERLMAQPWVATASDGGVNLPEDGPAIHARYYGTFPRKLAHYVRESHAISLEFAVRAATSLPAQILGLQDRGFLRPGQAADIVVFDAEEIKDVSTFTDPHRYSRGIEYLWVNGVPVVFQARPTGSLPGIVLRKN